MPQAVETQGDPGGPRLAGRYSYRSQMVRRLPQWAWQASGQRSSVPVEQHRAECCQAMSPSSARRCRGLFSLSSGPESRGRTYTLRSLQGISRWKGMPGGIKAHPATGIVPIDVETPCFLLAADGVGEVVPAVIVRPGMRALTRPQRQGYSWLQRRRWVVRSDGEAARDHEHVEQRRVCVDVRGRAGHPLNQEAPRARVSLLWWPADGVDQVCKHIEWSGRRDEIPSPVEATHQRVYC